MIATSRSPQVGRLRTSQCLLSRKRDVTEDNYFGRETDVAAMEDAVIGGLRSSVTHPRNVCPWIDVGAGKGQAWAF